MLPIASVCKYADLATVTAILGKPIAKSQDLDAGEKAAGASGSGSLTHYCQWTAAPQTRTRSGATAIVHPAVSAAVEPEPLTPEFFAERAKYPLTEYCKYVPPINDFGANSFAQECTTNREVLPTQVANVTVLVGSTMIRCGALAVGNSATTLRAKVEQFCLDLIDAASTESVAGVT